MARDSLKKAMDAAHGDANPTEMLHVDEISAALEDDLYEMWSVIRSLPGTGTMAMTGAPKTIGDLTERLRTYRADVQRAFDRSADAERELEEYKRDVAGMRRVLGIAGIAKMVALAGGVDPDEIPKD